MRKELLQRADGGAAGERNGLHAFARQIRKQTSAIGGKVLLRGLGEETMKERTKKIRKRWPKARDLFGSDKRPPCRMEVNITNPPRR
jgi:hypothetical protein